MAARNVLLVTIDSWRADALGPHMPVACDLSRRGVRFERAFATGNWTPFSFPGLLASRPVFADTGTIGVEGLQTLAETLSAAGVETGGFNAGNGFLTAHWGYDAGFDEFEPFVDAVNGSVSRFLATHPTVSAWVDLAKSPVKRVAARLRGRPTDRPFTDVSRLVDVESRATAFLERAEPPFFCWLHYMDAHTPYVPAPRHLREVSGARLGTHRMLLAHARAGLGRGVSQRTLAGLRTLYRATLRQIDTSLSRVLDALEASGVREETAVILVGDHGEEFMEHGHLAHYPKLYDELVHVPLVIDAPDGEATTVERAVGLDAIPPTVCSLLDVAPAEEWTGQDLLTAADADGPPPESPVVSVTVRGEEVTQQPIPRSLEEGELWVSARDRDWTYIEPTERAGSELYHRPTDPTQQVDRSDAPDAEALAAIERLQPVARNHARAIHDALERRDDRDPSAVEGDLAQRLEALGYR